MTRDLATEGPVPGQERIEVGDRPRLRCVPLELSDANRLVAAWHRHHQPSQGHRFSLGVIDDDGTLHGAAIVGRPVARPLPDRSLGRLLHRVLARREIGADAEQGGQDVRRLASPHLLEPGGHGAQDSSPPGPITGHSSTVSPGPMYDDVGLRKKNGSAC